MEFVIKCLFFFICLDCSHWALIDADSKVPATSLHVCAELIFCLLLFIILLTFVEDTWLVAYIIWFLLGFPLK